MQSKGLPRVFSSTRLQKPSVPQCAASFGAQENHLSLSPDGISDSVDMSLSRLGDAETDREAWRAAVHGAAKSQA